MSKTIEPTTRKGHKRPKWSFGKNTHYKEGSATMLTSVDIEETSQLLQRIHQNDLDAVQETWLKILEEGITDREQVTALAYKLHRQDVRNKEYIARKTLSLDEPLPYRDKESWESRLPSPQEDDADNIGTRAFRCAAPGDAKYGNPIALAELINREYKVACKFCDSTDTIKNGRRGKFRVQYRLCRTCGRGFTANGALPRWRWPNYIVREALRMDLLGYSYSTIQRDLYAMYKVSVRSQNTLRGWFKRLGIGPRRRDHHSRRGYNALLKKLVTAFPLGSTHNMRDIMTVCGYASSTKPSSTQLLAREMVVCENGGWRVSNELYKKVRGT